VVDRYSAAPASLILRGAFDSIFDVVLVVFFSSGGARGKWVRAVQWLGVGQFEVVVARRK